jgi:hypothetical protein
MNGSPLELFRSTAHEAEGARAVGLPSPTRTRS